MNPNFYHFFFQPTSGSWYTGNVWGNMVAWVICGVIAIIWGRRKLIKWDKKRKETDERRHREHINLLNKHHEELKAHISMEHEKSRKHLERITNGQKRTK